MCVFLAHLFIFLINQHYLAVPYPEIVDIVLNDVGHIGVLFFFVHTALVLMLSLDRSPSRRTTLNFYVRRLFRIYPLGIVCVLAVLLLKVPQVPYRPYESFDWAEIVSNLLFIQNLTNKAEVLMPLWTLAREVQMYLALPLIYSLVRRFSSPITPLLLWLAFSAATPYTFFFVWFPCFMGGVFAYQLSRERVFRGPAWLWIPSIVALLALHLTLAMTLLPDTRNDYMLCMFLGAVIPNLLDMRQSWVTEAAKTVAKYSYGVYLFHSPIIWISFVRLEFLPAPLRYATLMILMCAIPVLGYRLIEAPFIEIGRRRAARLSQPLVTSTTAPALAAETL